MFWQPDRAEWLLSDLSFAVPLGYRRALASLCVSVHGAAPEVVQAALAGEASVKATPALDAWQLGLLAYELATGSALFDREQAPHLVTAVLSGQHPLPWGISPVRRCSTSTTGVDVSRHCQPLCCAAAPPLQQVRTWVP